MEQSSSSSSSSGDIENLISKLGLTLESEKGLFRELVAYVTGQGQKTSSSSCLADDEPRRGREEEGQKKKSSPLGMEMESLTIRLRTVFRKHFRLSPFIDLEAAGREADACLAKGLDAARDSERWSKGELEELEAVLRTRLARDKGWIGAVNQWKCDGYRRSAEMDRVNEFRRQLGNKFPSGGGGVVAYEDGDIINFSEGLVEEALEEFRSEMPAFLRNEQLSQWCGQLRQELSQIQAHILEENRKKQNGKESKEEWDKRTEVASGKYRQKMAQFLSKNLFATRQAVEGFHAGVKAECERELGMDEIMFKTQTPNAKCLKDAWNLKINEEYRALVDEWKSAGDQKILAFQEALEVQGHQIFKGEFPLEMDSARFAAQFLARDDPETVRRKLEKAAAGQISAPDDEVDLDSIPSSSSGTGTSGGHTNNSVVIESGDGNDDSEDEIETVLVDGSSSSSSSSDDIRSEGSMPVSTPTFVVDLGSQEMESRRRTRNGGSGRRSSSASNNNNKYTAPRLRRKTSFPPITPEEREERCQEAAKLVQDGMPAKHAAEQCRVPMSTLWYFMRRHQIVVKDKRKRAQYKQDDDDGGRSEQSTSNSSSTSNSNNNRVTRRKDFTSSSIWICHEGQIEVIFPANSELPTSHFGMMLLDNNRNYVSITVHEGADSSSPGSSSTYLLELYLPRSCLVDQKDDPCLEYSLEIDSCGFLSAKWGLQGSGKKKTFHRVVKTSAWCGTKSSSGSGGGSSCRCQNTTPASAASAIMGKTLSPIGVLYDDQEYDVIIPSNTEFPSVIFRSSVVTSRNFATSDYLPIYEGEKTDSPTTPNFNQLGQILWTGIPSAEQGAEALDFTMEVDARGALLVEWEVRATGKKGTETFKTSAWRSSQGYDLMDQQEEQGAPGCSSSSKMKKKRPSVGQQASNDANATTNMKKARM